MFTFIKVYKGIKKENESLRRENNKLKVENRILEDDKRFYLDKINDLEKYIEKLEKNN